MNKKKLGILISTIIVFAGILYYVNVRNTQVDQAASTPVVAPEVPMINLSPKDAGAKILENIAIRKSGTPSPTHPSDYFSLNATINDGKIFSKLLRQTYNGPTSLIVITAEITRPKVALPPTPILVLKINEDTALDSDVLYQATGQIFPSGTYMPNGEADVALDIHFLAPATSNKEIESILKLANNLASENKLWSNTTQKQFTQINEIAATTLKKSRIKFYDNLLQLHIGPEDVALPGRQLSFQNTATIEFITNSIPAKFSQVITPDNVTIKTQEIDQYLSAIGPKIEELLVDFWLNEGEGFSDTCRDLSEGLEKQVGLSIKDTAVLLWGLIHRHAWFAKDIDYQTDCLNEAQTAALQNLKLELPNKTNTQQTKPNTAQMNAVLTSMVKVLRNENPEKSKINLTRMIAEKITLLDRVDLWLFGDSIKQNDSGRILESANQHAAVEQLLALPVSHFGCFSRGEGLKGMHRTTLAQFGTSNDLWELDFAFNTQGKIAGITLDEANNETICRAIGDRRTGDNACYFAKNAHKFPQISKLKCGR